MADLTQLLQRAAAGDADATNDVVEHVYDELERVAARQMRHRHSAYRHGDLTIEPAALVHDTLMKLIANPRSFENRRHFYSFAAKIMVRVLQDYQRRRRAQKRGGDQLKLTLGAVDRELQESIDLDRLPAELEELRSEDERKAEVVQLRVFWGLSMAEIAEVVGVSVATVERDWAFSRSWLAARLSTPDTSTAGKA